MKLFSTVSEKLAIRTAVSGTPIGSFLLASLTKECFSQSSTSKTWGRVLRLMEKTGSPPDWDTVLEDTAIDETIRKQLRAFKKKPIRNRDRAVSLVKTLHDYKKLRQVFHIAEYISDTVKKPSIEIEDLIEYVSDSITKARSTFNSDTIFTHIGKGNTGKKVLELLLTDQNTKYIPTGFDAFDKKNRGLRIRGVTILAGTTGGGKTAMALNMSKHMSLHGAKVAYGSFEMDAEELMMRRVADVCDVEMTKLLDPTKRLTLKERNAIRQGYKKYQSKLKKAGGLESYIVPEEDMSMEEFLFLLKPYGYNVIIIDYIGLMKGMDEEDMWRKLSGGVRFAKRFAVANDCLIIINAQFSDDGLLRYSRGMKEHATNLWSWRYDDLAKETNIVMIDQGKARQQQAFPFPLYAEFSKMRYRDLTDDEMEMYGGIREGGEDVEDKRGKRNYKGKGGKKDSKFSKGYDNDEDYFKLQGE